MSLDYTPLWLSRPDELQTVFTKLNIATSDGEKWLTRALRDRGAVIDREAHPAVDLFRVPDLIKWARLGEAWIIDGRPSWSWMLIPARCRGSINSKNCGIEIS